MSLHNNKSSSYFVVSLQLETGVVSIGGYIILTCIVHGKKTIDNEETRQWSKGYEDELLCYNGRIHNSKKYEEKVLQGNKFSLKILNVTEEDVNVVYQCRYGFDAANKFIEKDDHDRFCKCNFTYTYKGKEYIEI